MTSSERAAEYLVDSYLGARTLPGTLRRTAVWVTETRLVNGDVPVLDDFLRRDIDGHAIEPFENGLANIDTVAL